jgi:hypothetical protein
MSEAEFKSLELFKEIGPSALTRSLKIELHIYWFAINAQKMETDLRIAQNKSAKKNTTVELRRW